MKNSDPGGGVPHGVLCGISCRLLDTNPIASPLNVNMLDQTDAFRFHNQAESTL